MCEFCSSITKLTIMWITLLSVLLFLCLPFLTFQFNFFPTPISCPLSPCQHGSEYLSCRGAGCRAVPDDIDRSISSMDLADNEITELSRLEFPYLGMCLRWKISSPLYVHFFNLKHFMVDN